MSESFTSKEHVQCWDGYAKWCIYNNVPYANCTNTGFVRDIWEGRQHNGTLKYFDEVEVMQAGDVAVFKVVPSWTPYSHIALFDRDAGGGYGWFLGQGQTYDPKNPLGGSGFTLQKLPYSATYPTAFRLKAKAVAETRPTNTANKLLTKGDIVLDVASYQDEDLTNTLATVGTRKTIVKLTEGTTYLNPKHAGQIRTSDNVGYYHFARFGGDVSLANAEADYFVKNLPADSVGKLGVCDYEADAGGNAQANTEAILVFMRKVKQAGLIPVIYTYTSYLPNLQIDRILSEFPDSFWEAWYATLNRSDSVTWEYQPRLSGKAMMWQWTSAYKGLNLDANVVLKDIGTITNTLDEALSALEGGTMNFVIRSKSGKQGYLAVVNGKRMGVGQMDTIHQFQKAGFVHLNLDDGDFNRFLALFPTADESKTINVKLADPDVRALADSLKPVE